MPSPARRRACVTSTAVIPAQPSAIDSLPMASTSPASPRMLANACAGADISTVRRTGGCRSWPR
ncbi:MAG: hypothetical protein ACXVW7_05855 [Trebonia sp.]